VGDIRCLRAVASGRNASSNVGRMPCDGGESVVAGSEGAGRDMKVPEVASDACCKKELEPARESMSMGILRRWAAKMVFMKGIYSVGEVVLTEITRIRDVSGAGAVTVVLVAVEVAAGPERRVVCLFM